MNISKCEFCHSKPARFKNQFVGYSIFCGNSCAQKSEITRQKIKTTILEQYGVDHNMKLQKCLDQRKETWKQNLGVDNPAKSKKCIEQMKAVKFKRYGKYLGGFHSSKYANTMVERYGVQKPMHCSEIQAKVANSKRKSKKFKMPSGQNVHIQGYEHFALELLLKQFNEDEIRIHSGVPSIIYTFDEITHYHFPDIFIPSRNKIIEVKSGYTFKADFKKNLAKRSSAILKGYDYEIWIFGRNKKELKIITSGDQMKLKLDD